MLQSYKDPTGFFVHKLLISIPGLLILKK